METKLQLFRFFKELMGEEEALKRTILRAMLNLKKIKTRHLHTKSSFTIELILKYADTFNELVRTTFVMYMQVLAYEDMVQRQTFQGLGGCVPIEYDEAYQHQLSREENIRIEAILIDRGKLEVEAPVCCKKGQN